MKKYRLSIGVIIIFLIVSPAAAIDPVSCLPEAGDLPGWRILETRSVRTDNDLFDYIDGGAEMYRAFNFRRLAVREFATPGSDTLESGSLDSGSLIVELYMFKEPADAFGMFSMVPAGETLPLGDGGGYVDGVVRFWKGPFLCKVFFNGGEWEFYKDAVINAGEAVDERIDITGSPPEIINIMPREDLAKYGLHYFHEYIAQKNLYYIVPYNLFNLTRKTEAVMGEYYTVKAENVKLFLVKYPSESVCSMVYRGILEDYLKETAPGSKGSFHFKKEMKDSRTVEIDRVGKYLLMGFEEIHHELLTERFRQLRDNLTAYLGR